MSIDNHLQDLKPKLRLNEIERLLRKYRIVIPIPTRASLVNYCDNGTWDCVFKSGIGWLVYEESFLKWVKNLDVADMRPREIGESNAN